MLHCNCPGTITEYTQQPTEIHTTVCTSQDPSDLPLRGSEAPQARICSRSPLSTTRGRSHLIFNNPSISTTKANSLSHPAIFCSVPKNTVSMHNTKINGLAPTTLKIRFGSESPLGEAQAHQVSSCLGCLRSCSELEDPTIYVAQL